jgi:hypothetical protein
MSSEYYIRITVEKPTGNSYIDLPKCSSHREVEDICSRLEQFILTSMRGEKRKLVE